MDADDDLQHDDNPPHVEDDLKSEDLVDIEDTVDIEDAPPYVDDDRGTRRRALVRVSPRWTSCSWSLPASPCAIC